MDERGLDEETLARVAQVVRDQIDLAQILIDAAKSGSWGELVVAYDEAIGLLQQRKQEAYDRFNTQRASRRPIPMHPSAPPISIPLPRPPGIPSVARHHATQDLPTKLLPGKPKRRLARPAPAPKNKKRR